MAIEALPRPTFTHSRKALKEFLAGEPDRAKRWEQADTNRKVRLCEQEDRAAREKLAQALYKDTCDRNRLEDCRHVHWTTIQAWIEGRPSR